MPVTVEDVAYAADGRNSQFLTGTQVQHLTTSQISVDSTVRDTTTNELVRDSIKPLAQAQLVPDAESNDGDQIEVASQSYHQINDYKELKSRYKALSSYRVNGKIIVSEADEIVNVSRSTYF